MAERKEKAATPAEEPPAPERPAEPQGHPEPAAEGGGGNPPEEPPAPPDLPEPDWSKDGMDEGRASLHAAIARVEAGVKGKVPKNGWNDFHKFHYATESDVSETVRVLMGIHGVTVTPDVIAVEMQPAKTGNNRDTYLWVLTLDMYITDARTGYQEVRSWRGYANDPDDKGFAKALTNGVKYFLLKLFHLSSDDNNDTDAHGSEGAKREDRSRAAGQEYSPKPSGASSRPAGQQRSSAASNRVINDRQQGLVKARLFDAQVPAERHEAYVKAVTGKPITQLTGAEMDAVLEWVGKTKETGEWPADQTAPAPPPSEPISDTALAQRTYSELKAFAESLNLTSDDLNATMRENGWETQRALLDPEHESGTRLLEVQRLLIARAETQGGDAGGDAPPSGEAATGGDVPSGEPEY